VESAFAKLGRAQSHLAELRASVDKFRASDLSSELSHRVRYPYGDDDPRAVVTLRLELRAPLEWSLIMGDILTNVRAALDHAVYGHGTSRRQLNSEQRKSLYHPMSSVSAEWDSTPETTLQDGTLKPARKGVRENLQDIVDADVLDVIERNQPFNAADGDAPWHGLAILSGLVNRDKHRALLDIPVNVAELVLGESNIEIISEGDLRFLQDGTVEKEITIRRAHRPRGAAPGYRLGLFQADASFLEGIEIPNTGGRRRSFIVVMEKLVEMGGQYLDELKAAGC
jgi:hypothetical protein